MVIGSGDKQGCVRLSIIVIKTNFKYVEYIPQNPGRANSTRPKTAVS